MKKRKPPSAAKSLPKARAKIQKPNNRQKATDKSRRCFFISEKQGFIIGFDIVLLENLCDNIINRRLVAAFVAIAIGNRRHAELAAEQRRKMIRVGKARFEGYARNRFVRRPQLDFCLRELEIGDERGERSTVLLLKDEANVRLGIAERGCDVGNIEGR